MSAQGGGGAYGAQSGALGYGNETKSGHITISCKLANTFYRAERAKANSPYPPGEAHMGNVMPNEIVFDTHEMRFSDKANSGHAAILGSSLNGLFSDVAEMFRDDENLMKMVILDSVNAKGVATSGAELALQRHTGTQSTVFSTTVAGVVTLPALGGDFYLGDKLKLAIHSDSSRFGQRPNGIPPGKVILKVERVDSSGLCFSKIFRDNMKLFHDGRYREHFNKHHSSRASERITAYKQIEDSMLSLVMLGVHLAQNRGDLVTGDVVDTADKAGLVQNTVLTQTQQNYRKSIMDMIFLSEDDINSNKVMGVAAAPNPAVIGGREVDNMTPQGKLTTLQLNATHKLAEGMGALHRLEEKLIFGTCERSAKKGEVVDVLLH
jgi:hypothetical protein